MKSIRYKSFKEYILKANEDSDIWYDGYLFLDLTEKQHNEVRNICMAKGFKVENETVYLPSGIGLRKV